MAPPPEQQLAWFVAALDDLDSFLLSPDVFRPALGLLTAARTDLSLGSLLLTADAIGASGAALSPARRAEADRALRRWQVETSRRQAALARKAGAEAPARANLWRAYVTDLAEAPREAGRYAQEVRHRVILARLAASLDEGDVGPGGSDVAAADQALRARFIPGAFVWETYLEPVYPAPEFWYLHGAPLG